MKLWLREGDNIGTRLTKSELFQHFRVAEPDLNVHTFAWRIHELCKRNVLRPVGRGQYSLQPKPIYVPQLSQDTAKLAVQIQNGFTSVAHSILEAASLNEFSRHQSPVNLTIVEIEKEAAEPLFHHLRDLGRKEVFLKPDQRTMELYVLESRKPVIIVPLVSRSPLEPLAQGKRRIFVPTLEKMLVDLFCDEKIFFFWGGEETKTIFRNAADRFALNYTTLLSYASRRGKQPEMKTFLSETIGKEFQDLFP